MRAELDGIVKLRGLSLSAAAYVASQQDGSGFSDRELSMLGAHAQLGYVIAERYQPVLRYAAVAPTGVDNDTQEAAVGFAFYPHGHGLKWQSELALLVSELEGGGNGVDNRFQTQVQLAF